MNDFELGFLIGSLIVTVIVSPITLYFGVIYFNIRKMENAILKQNDNIKDPDIPKEITDLVKQAEKILETNNSTV